MTTETTQAAPAEAPKPGTPEYDVAMAAKFDNRNVVADPSVEEKPAAAAQPQAAQRPEWFPENLWKADQSLEDNSKSLAGSYAEARKTISQKPAAAPAAAAAAAAPAADVVKQQLEANLAAVKAKPGVKPEEIAVAEQALSSYKPAAPAATKVDFTPFENEYAETGTLSAESYTKLEEMGFKKVTIDSYIAGLKATEVAYEAQAHEAAGSKETFTQMTTWAATALTEAEVNAFNSAVTSGNVEAMRMAVQAVHSKFVAANGQQPKLLGGGDRPNGSALAFRDKSEMTAAMRDPRYKTSEAFRADVAARLLASTF